MDWKDLLPEGIDDIQDTNTGFEASISIPVDDDGYFGRECPECGRLFKMDAAEYRALPDELKLICPYCGERRDHDEFMTPDQQVRLQSAFEAMAEQYLQQTFDDMMRRTFRRGVSHRSVGNLISLEWQYQPGRPPITRELYEYVEERIRRTLVCPRCSAHVGVYGATAFCPICGSREKTEEIRDAIAAQRLALSLPNQLADDVREQARAAGVFDQHAEAAIKDVVTLFETYMRGVFVTEVPNHVQALAKERQTVFQSIGDTERLLRDHLGWDVRAAVDNDVLDRLSVVFEQRHVLVHRHGEVDARFAQRVSTAGLRIGQRLTVSRTQAERGLNDLEAVVEAIERFRSKET
jgi:uncharacterized Zn finger protein (UPF0148 family)